MTKHAVLLSLFALASVGSASENQATPVDRIKILEGFEIELLYSVPYEEQGSWVAMCVDPEGRLIVSDQYGAMYRVAVPPLGRTQPLRVERIDLDIGHAWGCHHAFGSLYVVVNDKAHGGRGLYRVRDTDGDDAYDKVELLRKFEEQGGEHGPHAVLPGPDGESLYVVVGNQTALTEHEHSRVPPVWGEDQLLPRIYGRGFMKGKLAPRGWIAKTDPDGKSWEIVATGFRNQYDAAFNRQGDLFTYDADMEWDMNTPWYRPTRICQVVSGAEFGWRNGSAKWPAHYPDSVGPVVDIGPGSPTGVCFGYGARFRSKYQEAFFAADWSYGKLYAVHMKPQPDGAGYEAEFEEFLSAQPMPLTDLVVNPVDGALYIAIGGRRVQSGLYRVTDTRGVDPVEGPGAPLPPPHRKRRVLEAAHRPAPGKLDFIWSQLGSQDRSIRYAARVALEHQPLDSWLDRLGKPLPFDTAIQSVIALARQGEDRHKTLALSVLGQLDPAVLDRRQRLDAMRALGLVFIRLGAPTENERADILNVLEEMLPAGSREENVELADLLVYLQAPSAAAKIVDLLEAAPTQEEQMSYAKSLRLLKEGWTPELRARYFRWFVRARTFRGGNSFGLFVGNIRKDALAQVPEAEMAAIRKILDTPVEDKGPRFTVKPRSFVKVWTVDDLAPKLDAGLKGGRDFENGRNLFGATSCFACHRFDNEGGAIGPDLTSVGGKFGPRDLLVSILEPSREISDQYGAMAMTKKNGETVVGRIVNLAGGAYRVNVDMMNPNAIVKVDRDDVVSIEPSKVSMMPPGLLNTLTESDVLDLLAYLLSRGDRDDPRFK